MKNNNWKIQTATDTIQDTYKSSQVGLWGYLDITLEVAFVKMPLSA